jgi:hypothetical protein
MVASTALERVFGPRAVCNACAAAVAEYRVVALFLHDTAVIRAYCASCYPAATEGEYRAGGDGLVLDYADFAGRFGAPGPPPPPATSADRALAALVRDPTLRRLSPPSEAFARRRGSSPYRVGAAFLIGGSACEATFTLAPDGGIAGLEGAAAACERIQGLTQRL